VKRWKTIVLAIALLLGFGCVAVTHWQQLGLAGPRAIGADDSRDVNEPSAPTAHPATIMWTKVDRSGDGFRVDMPSDVKQIQIPAYNESGAADQVNMIFSNPDADTQFSVAWEDNPPVARVSNRAPDRTLQMAREGALAWTQTVLVSEGPHNTQGFPGREFEARNSGGGVMNSRLIYAGSRLYMLNAAFPSASARRDKDVTRFFNSFVVTSTPGSGKAGSPAPSKAD
jgi:hypothetical protein